MGEGFEGDEKRKTRDGEGGDTEGIIL